MIEQNKGDDGSIWDNLERMGDLLIMASFYNYLNDPKE